MTDHAALARALHGLIEPIHAIGYFAPESAEEYEALGLEPVAQGYVAGRAAAMGPIGPDIARSVFYNFSPQLIGLGVPGAWELASPRQVLDARARAIERFYTRVGAPSHTVAEATELARAAARQADIHGRPLAAANLAVEPPQAPFAALWQALTVLREHRGDGHIALLTSADVGPVDALVLYASWQSSVSRRFLQRTRLWDDDAWEAATERLEGRGWLTGDGTLTEAGAAWRERVEADTDRLAAGPYAAIGEDAARRLFDLLRPLAEALRDAEAFPRALTQPTPPD
jgi:hypothetical protein